SNFIMLLAATRGHAELFYRTLRKTVIGIDPSGRGALFQESSSPFNSYGENLVVSSQLGKEARSIWKLMVFLAGSRVYRPKWLLIPREAALFAEDLRAEIILQTLHLQTDGGGGAAKMFCRLRQATKVVSDRKRPQRIQIKVDSR